jgi:hypothetical protein
VTPSVERVIAEKLTGFQLTKELLYCMEPELSFPYITLKIENKIKKSDKTYFKDFNIILNVKYFPQ